MKKVTGYLLISIHALIFLFFFFNERLVFPPWIQSLGRVHPLLLHLPIGVLVLTVLLVLFRRGNYDLISFLLAFTAVTSAVTALMGIILGAEGGYDSDALHAHRLSGVSMSVIAWATCFVYTSFPERATLHKVLLGASTIVLLVTGHLGSVMTHGDQYVLDPLLRGSGKPREAIPDTASLFRAAVFPVLEAKCLGCHNSKKKKGGLSFSSGITMMKGGEHGEPWKPGEPNKSLIVSRILLPENHEDHMPPEGKPQLSITEANLLFYWIHSGADTSLAWTSYSKKDTVRRLAEALMTSRGKTSHRLYHFDEAADKTVFDLNDAYRTVTHIAASEPALSVSMFIREQYRPERLRDLLAIKEQLVDLNLSEMPVSDEDCKVIARFINLEKLNLNSSSITSKCLVSLSALGHLRTLSLAGTSLNDDDLLQLKGFPAVKEVFIWNTRVSDPAKIAAILEPITVQAGAVVDEKEILRLSPPLLVNESMILDEGDSVRFNHKLAGTIIRYTLDGSEPDTVTSQVFSKPLALSSCTELKVVACKPGWYCSNTARFLFFTKGATPSIAKLNTLPNKDYRGEGAVTLYDNKKGFADNFRGDIAWLGYKEDPFDALFSFDSPTQVSEIVISYAKNIPAFLFPPASAEIWAGNNKGQMKLIREVTPPQPAKAGSTMIEALKIPLDQARYSYYRVVIRPVPQLPSWHPANRKETKDKRAWVFVDEVFFN